MSSVQSAGVDIHFEVRGSGPPLILHTGGGGDLQMWELAGFTDLLGPGQLVLMDHRGHGKSGRPTDIEHHRIDAYVDDVLAVADAVGAARFSFFGYSGGASVGYRLASRYPDRLDGLIGLGAVGAADEDRAEDVEWAASVRSGGSGLLADTLQKIEPDIPAWFLDQMRSTDPEMFALMLEGWMAWEGPWSEFGLIRVPTLIVVGELEEGDGDLAAANARRAADLIPDGRAVVLADLAHCMAFVRSDLVAPEVRSFLDGLRGTDS